MGRTAIVVAGMHRSGTSAATRVVNLLGAELVGALIPAGIGNERGHWESSAVQALHNDLLRIEELWADGLAHFGGPFLAGERFTAVDAFFCPVAFRIQTYNPPMGEKAKAYAFRLLTLDPMIAWSRAALLEDFRDPPHDADAMAAGTITEDHRAPEKV